MKNTKRIISIVLTFVIVASLSVNVFASNGINNAEQRVLDKLNSGIQYGTASYTVNFPQDAINAANTYFITYDMTEDQADQIIGDINAAQARAETENISSLGQLSGSTKSYILDKATDAAAVVGLKLTYTNGVITITDANGNVLYSYSFASGNGIGTNNGVIKATGSNVDVTTAGVVVASILVLIAVGAVLIKKYNLIKE